MFIKVCFVALRFTVSIDLLTAFAAFVLFTGPSDTTTKLLDNCEEHVAVRTPRTIITARLIAVATVAFHRSYQMLSSKDPSRYKSLYHYRNAANQRSSMAGSLARLLRLVTDELKYEKRRSPTVACRLNPMLVPPNSPPRRDTRQSGEAPQRVSWAFMESTGYTPKRGRSSNEMHQRREKHCDGRVLVWMAPNPSTPKADVRSACRLCGSKTAFYCTGCKNFLCHGSQVVNESRIKKIQEDEQHGSSKEVKPLLKMQVYDPKKDDWSYTFAKNCCYLVSHKHAFDAVWQTKHSVIKGVDEQETTV